MVTNATEAAGYPAPAKANYLLFCLIAAYIYSFIDRQLFALIANNVKGSLHLSDFEIGLIQGLAFSLFFCLAAIPIGRLIDRYDRRWIIIGGLVLWSVATASSGLAGGFATLFLARMCIGIGEATVAPAAYSMIPDAFRPERLVRAFSLFQLGATFGTGMAFIFGGAVIALVAGMEETPFGLEPWRVTFLAAGAGGLIALVLLLVMRDPPRRAAAQAQDALPFREAFDAIWARRGDYLPIYLCSVFLSATAYATLLWYPTHLIRVHDFEPGRVGIVIGILFLITSPLGTLVSTLTTEWLARRGHGDAPVRVILGMSLLIAPACLNPLVPNLYASLALFSVMAFCQGGFAGNIVASLQFITPSRLRGLNSAIYMVVLNIGALGIGAALVGAISDGWFPGQAKGLSYAMTIVAFGAAIGAILSSLRALKRFRAAIERTGGKPEA
jgi:MFS family permease